MGLGTKSKRSWYGLIGLAGVVLLSSCGTEVRQLDKPPWVFEGSASGETFVARSGACAEYAVFINPLILNDVRTEMDLERRNEANIDGTAGTPMSAVFYKTYDQCMEQNGWRQVN